MSLASLPVELFLDNILPLLPLRDLLNVTSVNRTFQELGSDETLWHRKLEEDFNFPSSETARRTGWKFIYQRLFNPKVYVWGDRGNGRLGLSKIPDSDSDLRVGVPFPVPLAIPGVRIVSLVAGGMSFNAIDSHGDLYVWGALDGQGGALRSEGFSSPYKRADQPKRLQLPVKFRSISCGRLHSTALDAFSQVWIFTSWGRPFRLESFLLDRSSPESTPVQISSGWTFTSILTRSGDVFVCSPFTDPMQQVINTKNEELDEQASPAARAEVDPRNSDVIPCHWWVMEDAHPIRLPPIPAESLPQLAGTGLSENGDDEDTKLIQIAGLDNTIIGLTNKGHVLRFSFTHGPGEASATQDTWEYLPHFCELEKVREHPTFRQTAEGQPPLDPPSELKITHISAQFQTFVAYSTGKTSIVLMGQSQQGPRPYDPLSPFIPKIIPELQHRGVISVVLGDYHYGALTASGKLLTWGQFSKGALGLGDPAKLEPGQPGGYRDEQQRREAVREWGVMFPPQDVRTPAEVHFNYGEKTPREKFCFAAAAGGWHMGAIVVDLEPGDNEDDEDVVQDMPGAFPRESTSTELPETHYGQGQIPLFPFRGGARGRGIFRIGLAGRGLPRGFPDRGRGRGQ